MINLFPYETLEVSLNSSNKSITVYFNRPEFQNAINEKMVSELESFMNWLPEHLEVISVIFTSKTPIFSLGFDPLELQLKSNQEVANLYKRFRKIYYSFVYLPQTIIFDLKEKAYGEALEMSCYADIRIARAGCNLAFDHLHRGVLLGTSGLSILNSSLSMAFLNKWSLCGRKIPEGDLLASGLIQEIYTSDTGEGLPNIWPNNLFELPSVGRIQFKNGIIGPLVKSLEYAQKSDQELLESYLSVGDYKKTNKMGAKSFSDPKNIKRVLNNKKDNIMEQ